MLLLLDTSGARCSVALAPIGVSASASENTLTLHCDGVRQHSEELLQMIAGLLLNTNKEWSDLHALCFNQGPGAFTGLRVAAGVVQGIAFAHQLPVIPLPLHDAIAYDYFHQTKFVGVLMVITHAQMQELYASVYTLSTNESSIVLLQSVTLIHQSDLLLWINLQKKRFVCTGVTDYKCLFLQKTEDPSLSIDLSVVQTDVWDAFSIEQFVPYAHSLYQQQAWVTAEQALPLYVRDKVAFTTEERLSGRAVGGNPRAPAVLPSA